MIRFNYPDWDHRYLGLCTVHAIFHDPGGHFISRSGYADRSRLYEFEIKSFELGAAGVTLA